jgi:hypothetical protein
MADLIHGQNELTVGKNLAEGVVEALTAAAPRLRAETLPFGVQAHLRTSCFGGLSYGHRSTPFSA